MISCGSGSDFGKILVLVPDPDKIWQGFPTTKSLYKILLQNVTAALFLRKLASHFGFVDLFIPFYVGSGSKSPSGTNRIRNLNHHCCGSVKFWYGSGSADPYN
jgi:hypothetical protein